MQNNGPLKTGLLRHFSPEALEKLANARIGIAGAGGLGSNAAMLLARSGIENMLVVDGDIVEESNLNRQHFWPDHLGMPKVEALGQSLLRLNDAMRLALWPIMLTCANVDKIVAQCPIWVEALDSAETKALFVERALLAGCRVAAASGLCGIGGPAMQTRKMGRLALVGDFVTSAEHAPPFAPRVMQAAALLADCVLEFVLE